MSESGRGTSGNWWKTPLLDLLEKVRQREDQVFLILSLVIGALTGLAVVAFIMLTERLGMRLYPVGGAPWRRLLFPVVGSLGIGYLLYRYFPNARGSGVPQTKAALFAREGRITLRTVLGKVFACRQRWRAESRWAAKGHRFKLARALARCWDGFSA